MGKEERGGKRKKGTGKEGRNGREARERKGEGPPLYFVQALPSSYSYSMADNLVTYCSD